MADDRFVVTNTYTWYDRPILFTAVRTGGQRYIVVLDNEELSDENLLTRDLYLAAEITPDDLIKLTEQELTGKPVIVNHLFKSRPLFEVVVDYKKNEPPVYTFNPVDITTVDEDRLPQDLDEEQEIEVQNEL